MRKPATDKSKMLSEAKLKELKHNANMLLADARRNMIQCLPFAGSVAMSLDLIPVRDEAISTAATDGKRIYFDIAFLSSLKPDEVLFVIAHETYHCILIHFIRQAGRNATQWNYATDIEANNMLIADGLSMPNDGLSSKKFRFEVGLSAEDYYELLANDLESNQNQDGDGQDSGNENGEMAGQFDKHIYQDTDTSSESLSKNVCDKYGKVGKDPDYQPKVEECAIDKMRELVLSAAQQYERSRGELPGHIKSVVNKLLKPQLPWKEILSQWITKTVADKTTWSRPNRRFVSSGVYLPSHSGEMVKVGVIMDTSGSCTNDAHKFLSEINSIVKSFQYEMTLIQCDYIVQRVDTYNEESPLDLENTAFEISSNGGTHMTPAFRYFEENDIDVDCIICFTDANIENIEEDFCATPVLWAITGNCKANNIKCGEKMWLKD